MAIDIKNGQLYIGSLTASSLAEKYGTPLYIMDEDAVRDNMRALKSAIDKYYDSEGMITYASKALCIKEMCKIANEEGLGLDCVSGGELYTAYASGFPMEKIHYHGNNKTDEEIKLGISYRVGKFIVDNTDELIKLNEYAKEADIIQDILLRITPGVEAHTHDFIKTGQIDSKFGCAIKTGAADEITKKALEA